MTDGIGGDVFLLLPCVLLEGGASTNEFDVGGLGLASVKRLLERVLIEGGGELSSTMLSMGGRPSLYGTISEQVSDESSPLLVDLGLANRDAKHFFVGVGRFTTFIFFSQPGGNLPAYKYHPLSFSCHSNMADLL